VITQLQLLLFSALAFTVLNRWKIGGTAIYPPELPSVNLDTDWLYRRPFLRVGQSLSLVERLHALAGRTRSWIDARVSAGLHQLLRAARQLVGPAGWLPRTWSISAKVACAAMLLTGYLVLYYVYM
jgi:multicomponent Na+:H+ antiporter subunit D